MGQLRKPTADSRDAPSANLLPRGTLPFKASRTSEQAQRARVKRSLKQVFSQEPSSQTRPSFASLDAPPSSYPAPKYCDLSGFVAKYRDPRSGLLFSDAHSFAQIRRLPPAQVHALRALRQPDADEPIK
jgi:INO80 complex subunit C